MTYFTYILSTFLACLSLAILWGAYCWGRTEGFRDGLQAFKMVEMPYHEGRIRHECQNSARKEGHVAGYSEGYLAGYEKYKSEVRAAIAEVDGFDGDTGDGGSIS